MINYKSNTKAGRALVVGNSDGIGLGFTRMLLSLGWQAAGISRSKSPLKDSAYRHIVMDVRDKKYPSDLKKIMKEIGPLDLCLYCAGIGELLDLSDMDSEAVFFEVNLVGMVKTASSVIPHMLKKGNGHFMGISSVADELLSPDAPSYHASKAGFSNYLEGLALALRKKGVVVTNVRFGFVDTKMAKGDIKPFMMSIDTAVNHLLKCLRKKPARYTAPLVIVPFIKIRKWMMALRL